MMICVTALMVTSAQAVTVDIYSGHTQVGGGAPYSNLVTSFVSPDIMFGTNSGWNWFPLGDQLDFGAEMTGCLRVAADAIYEFGLNSDDGSMLYIDGVLVVDNGGGHPPLLVYDETFLTAGKHAFKVEFFEDFGGASGVDLILPDGVTYAPCVDPAVTKTANPSDIWLADSCATPQTTTITLTVTGYGGTITETLPIDVVFGIDSSGSMSWNDPSGQRKTAAKSFADKLDAARDQAGVASWDDNVDFTYGLSSNLTEVKNRIDNVDSSGGTNLNVGLNACIAILDTNTRTENSVEVIVFLSNGAGTYTYAANNGPAANAASKGYVIYSIGLGSTPATGPLTDMAIATGGAYYPSPTADNLQAIFDTIFTTIITSTAPQNVDLVEVTQPYIIDEGSFSVTPDSVIPVDGKTKMVWNNVAQYVGNNDDRLAADETFTVSFTARSSAPGYMLPVDVPGMAVVHYTDPDGYPQTVPIPQAEITVGRCVEIDIKPQSCPNPLITKNVGVLPVAILGTGDLSVDNIIPDSIALGRQGLDETVPVLLWDYEDVETPFAGDLCDCHETGPDGVTDLTLKFSVPELVEKLKLEEIDKRTMIPLILLGYLNDGTPIQGADCVRVQ
jgi:Ca-activated chloride channel family protein